MSKQLTNNQFTFLSHKSGVSSKNGQPYEIFEVSKDFRNFTINLDPNIDRTALQTLEKGDTVELTFRIEGDFNARASAVALTMKHIQGS